MRLEPNCSAALALWLVHVCDLCGRQPARPCVCVWETLNQREKQGARGRIDGMGQRRPIYVVVKTYLQTPIVRYGKVAMPKTTHADRPLMIRFQAACPILISFAVPKCKKDSP